MEFENGDAIRSNISFHAGCLFSQLKSYAHVQINIFHFNHQSFHYKQLNLNHLFIPLQLLFDLGIIGRGIGSYSTL